MIDNKFILIVDDNAINRELLSEILKSEYKTIEAEDGLEALSILQNRSEQILAVLSDIVMPKMDGFALLEAIKDDQTLDNIPVIVMTASTGVEGETKALRMGAWDFISKPYNPEVILCRLRNAIARSRVDAAEQLRYLACHDPLTGMYNRTYFMEQTELMIRQHHDKQFVFVHCSINRFQLINSFYGAKEADRLILYLADLVMRLYQSHDLFTYGHIESDIFCYCMEYNHEDLMRIIEGTKPMLEAFESDFDLEPNYGVYIIQDRKMPAEVMYSKACLAAEKGEGSYLHYYTFYTDEMDVKLKKEQEILNDMHKALENREFCAYLQPKYNIHTNTVCGAEALVRWKHPEKGMISPGDFIPVFEKNGFVMNLDYYMWEETCKLLRSFIDRGIKPLPISVNVSRVNIYNSKLAENILQLVDKYELPHNLLELEITESAYTYNPQILIHLVRELRENGFTILMDDFGSGYSSLSILKDIEVDILKLDMLFLSNSVDNGRGENILASMIRMAKWLKIPVIVEGVEKGEQVDFLRSVGCDFVQGYYYARPMPADEYEQLLLSEVTFKGETTEKDNEDFDVDTLFQMNPQMKVLFGDLLQALAIFEFDGQNMEFVRINEGYFDVFGSDDIAIRMERPLEIIDSQYQGTAINAFRMAVKTKGTSECDFLRYTLAGTPIWVNMKLRYLKKIGGKHLLLALLDDVTAQKRIDFELAKYRQALIGEFDGKHRMLVVDDMAANRAILKKIFEDQYEIFEAENGREALDCLNEYPNISVILLDIVMPEMNGWEFLAQKKESPVIANIPVIIISAEDKPNEQEIAMDMGINDYIVKPFVPEIVKRRVNNAMDSIRFMQEAMKKVDAADAVGRIDRITGMYDLESAKMFIDSYLEDSSDDPNAMISLGIEDFAKISNKYMNHYDESLAVRIGKVIKDLFRSDDIAFRSSEGIFCIFAKNYKDTKKLKKRLMQLIELIQSDACQEAGIEINCKIGAVFSPGAGRSFVQLQEKAEKARIDAEKNSCRIYKCEK